MKGVDRKMITIDIYWNDLTENAKDNIKEVLGFDPDKESNWDVIPMASIDIELDEES